MARELVMVKSISGRETKRSAARRETATSHR
jgi:hypothetical protein